MARLKEDMANSMEGNFEGAENIIEESMFDEEDSDIQESVHVTSDMGGVGEDEICGEEAGVTYEFLKSLIEKLKIEIKSHGQPESYRNGSFWYRPRDPVFALEASRMASGINSRELYHCDVFVWLLGLPTRLPGEPEQLHCPHCQNEGRYHTLKRVGM